MYKIIGILYFILGWIVKLSSRKKKTDVERDQQVADDIRNGDGQKVAEEWKRRRNYEKNS